ncbi:MAG: PhzF family phenazine biosynthesis protein, partial [Bacteroidota bacterium]
MNLPFYIIDAFTSQKFKGNPTAVCLLTAPIDDKMMSSVTKELGFPVTAFIEK